MRHLLLAAGIALSIPLGAVPAPAAIPPGVLLTYDYEIVPFDSGYFVVVYCNASADPGEVEDVPVATVVTCSVNGLQKNRGVPGRESLVYINGTVVAPITVCMSGEAAFVQAVSNRVVAASAGPRCEVLPVV